MSAHSYVGIRTGNAIESILINTGGYYNDIGVNLLKHWDSLSLVSGLVEQGKIRVLNTKLDENIYFDYRDSSFTSSMEEIIPLSKKNFISMIFIFDTDENKWFTFYWNEWGSETSYLYIPLSLAIEISTFADENWCDMSEEDMCPIVDKMLSQKLA